MTLSPSPNKSKYHYRRALKLTAVILVVILVFRWRYNRQPAPVVYTAAVKNEWGEEDILTDEGGEEKDSLATVHIYNREEEEGNIESQVNEGSMTPSHLGENSSGSTQINIPSFSDYYEDDRKAVDLNPVVEEDSPEEDGFFGNIFSIFQGKEESEEEDIYPGSSSEGKMKTENATEASADVANPQDGMTVDNQSSVAEHSQNTTGETGGAQDSEGEAEASTKTNATEVEGDVSKTPADIQPSIVSVTEKMIVENADVVKTSNDTEIATEVYNNSAPVDTNTEKVGENNAASDSQEKEAISQAQVIETTTEPQEKSETLENEPHKQTDVVEDSLGRLGDLISGIRDVVEELKKNKDTPQIDGEGGDTQYQQPEGTEGSIVNSKHEALKPGGKLHGHIDELLTLTAHLTDFLHESQGKEQEEKEDPATKANAEEFQHPDNQNQDTETQDTQLADPVASSTDPDQVKVLDVTPIETTTQDAGTRIPESALAPLEEKENPVNQTQEPANKWKETTSEQLDAAEVKDAVRRETESVLAVKVPVASERLEPETLVQNPEPYLQERNGLPVDPRIEADTVQEAKIQENYTLQEQADGRIEPVAIIQEGEQVEPVVAGAEEGEQVENTLQQQTGERIEPANTVHESLIEGTDPAIKIQEHTTNMQEPADEKAESLLAVKEPVSHAIDSVTNVEELVPQNQEQAGEGETNADREDNLSTVLANLKNMVHGLHSHIDNIRSKNPRNDTNEPENRIGEDQLQSQSSESNNQLMDQANESIQSQNQYLEPENQRYETGNQQDDQIKDQENNDINREVMKEGEGERETEREAATGEKPKPEDETIRNDATGEEGGRGIGENKPMENVEEKQPETHKEGEQIEEERVVEGVNVKGGEATWQEDRRRRLREACRSRNPETDESVNETLNRSLYIQRSHTLVCAVSKAGLDTWKRTIEGLSSKGQAHDDQTRSSSFSSPPLLDLASLDLYTKIITVKHPMSRLFSSFLSKYHGGNALPSFPGQQAEAQTEAGREWIENYRLYWLPALQVNQILPEDLHLRLGLSSPLNADTRYEPEVYERLQEHLHPSISFTSFVRFVVHTFRTGTQRADWASYESSCSPCRVQYDHVAKVETLQEDLGFISKELDLPITLDPEEAFVETRRAAATLELSLKYYKLLPAEMREELLKFLRPDMELFGYKVPLSMRPSSDTPS